MTHLAQLDNRTPFAARVLPMPDGEGGELVLVVVKASFEFAADGTLVLASEQTPVRMADELDEDGPRWDADLATAKPAVDVVVNGTARAPYGEPATEVLVGVRVGDALRKRLVVRGARRWMGDGEAGPAATFVELPLNWSRAYGDGDTDPRNPVGARLPNIEYPDDGVRVRGDRPRPAGLGPIGRSWSPRRELAGTFDDRWQRLRWPLRPTDYDPAFEQSAPEDQRLARYVGGLEVELTHLTAAGIWLFRLPHIDVPVRCFHERPGDPLALRQLFEDTARVDTIEIDADARRLMITARATVPVDVRRPPLRDVVLGHPTPAWIRAKLEGKCYLDPRGRGSTDRSRRCFWT